MAIEALLRRPGLSGARHALAAIALATPAYGLVMGAYNGLAGDRALLPVYAAVKLPLMLTVTALVCIPGFVVINLVLGLGHDLRAALRAIVAGPAAGALALLSFAPVIAVAYTAGPSIHWATLTNLAAFAAATAAGSIAQWRAYAPLRSASRRHHAGLAAWTILTALVGVQTSWVLRPFIGSPGTAVQFLRDDAFTNGYVVIFRLLAGGLAQPGLSGDAARP